MMVLNIFLPQLMIVPVAHGFISCLLKLALDLFSLHFSKMIETQFNINIKAIRSNNGLEFAMLDFFSYKRVIHQTSCVDRPQQNSVVERIHQHLLLDFNLTFL